MDTVLRALYNGEIYPAEQYRPVTEEYRAILNERLIDYQNFIKKLDSSLADEFKRIMDEQLDHVHIEHSQMFIDGFRLGAKMIIEIYENKDGQSNQA